MPRRSWLFLGLLLLALLPALGALESRSFFSPDETSYAQVAREMLESGDFVVPRIDGHPWLEKPPLIYWLLATAFRLFGWGFPAAVLLNTLLTAATATLIAGHARRTAGPRAGVLAGAAYLTMFLPLATARSALTDPALTLCTTAAIVVFLGEGRFAATLSGICLGLGILAKGPVAPLVVIPAIVAAAIVRRKAWRWRRIATTIAVSIAVALPWHLALAGRGLLRGYAAVFLGQQVVSRAIDTWKIPQPLWLYLPVLWLAAFPWGIHLVLAGRDWVRRVAGPAEQRRVLAAEAAAVVIPLVALSAARNKLPHYVLPMLPWLAVWLGRAADELLTREQPDRVRRAVVAVAAALGALVIGGLPWWLGQGEIQRMLSPMPGWPLAVAAGALLLGGALEWSGRLRTAWLGLALTALAVRAGLDLGALPVLDRQVIERPTAAAVRGNLPPDGVPIAHRWWRSSLVAYGVRGWVRTNSPAELDEALAAAARERRPALVLALSDAEGEVRAAGWRRGGAAREVARIRGVGEIDGSLLEATLSQVDSARDGARWFYDADREVPGESGWSGLEGNLWTPSFRWSTELRAGLTAAVRLPGEATLRFRAWGPALRGQRQRLRVGVNACEVGQVELAPTPREFELTVPARCLAAPTQSLTLDARHRVAPSSEDPRSGDSRALAFALDWIALDPVSATIDLSAAR